MNTDLIAQLKIDEGLRLTLYKDSLGYETIGYGHKYNNDVPLDENDSITLEEAEQLLEKDVMYVRNHLQILLPWLTNLNEARQDALCNMAFNLGCTGLLKFNTFLDLIKKGEYAKAANDLKTTLWAKEVGQRATRLELVIITGVHSVGQNLTS